MAALANHSLKTSLLDKAESRPSLKGSGSRHSWAAETLQQADRGAQASMGLARLAYRAKHGEGDRDQEAHPAAVAAVQSVLPLLWKEVSAGAVHASWNFSFRKFMPSLRPSVLCPTSAGESVRSITNARTT